MGTLATRDLAFLMISSELPGIMGLVMRDPNLVAQRGHAEPTQESVVAAMLGTAGRETIQLAQSRADDLS